MSESERQPRIVSARPRNPVVERAVVLPSSLTQDAARLRFCYRAQQRLLTQKDAIELTLTGQARHDWHHDWLERLVSLHAVLNPLRDKVLGKITESDADSARLAAFKAAARAGRENDALVNAHPLLVPKPTRIEMVDPFEDWTSGWTEADPNSDITVAANTLTVTSMLRNIDAWVYKDYGVGHFGIAFTHNHVVNWTSDGGASTGGAGLYWGVSNVIDDVFYWNTNSSAAMWSQLLRGTAVYTFRLRDGVTGNADSFDGTTANCDQDVNCETVRSGATGATLTQVLTGDVADTLTITCTANTAYRHQFSVNSANNATTGYISWVVKNLDLNEAVAYIRSLADSLGVIDSAGRVTTFLRPATETLGLTDSAARVAAFVRDLADQCGITDSASRIIAFVRSFADSEGATDSAARIVAFVRSLADAEGLSDAAAEVLSAGLSAVIAIILEQQTRN